MAHKIGIYYDQSNRGLKGIMSSPEMEAMEHDIMLRKKSQIEAAFLQTFGVPGSFKFSVVRSQNKTWNGGQFYGGRVIYRIIPDNGADKGRTYSILKANPGWIDQFVD